MCGGNVHLWVQDILETSVQFDGDTNNPNLQTVLASLNTQRREEQVILSTIRCQETERLSQVVNDEKKIYENMLARRSGMNYSPGIQFQKILINMEEAK